MNDFTKASSYFSRDTERTIYLMLNDSGRRKFEIIWVSKSMCSSYSNNSSADINKVFQ